MYTNIYKISKIYTKYQAAGPAGRLVRSEGAPPPDPCLHLPLSSGVLVFWCFGLFNLFDLFDLFIVVEEGWRFEYKFEPLLVY